MLPPDFQFSQASLQDYVDCPRRFQLRYVERVAWPAPQADPPLENERYLQQGAAFHRLVHQHLLGLPAEQLSRLIVGEDLGQWWRNYLEARPPDLPPLHYPEVLLSAPVGGYRLVARYDLVAVAPGRRAVVVDWKTSRRRPRRERLAQRLQTRVYPYVLVRAGAQLNDGQPLTPAQVEMIYWFAPSPAHPERFVYDQDRYAQDEARLTALIEEIGGLAVGELPRTSQGRRCDYCSYRSLCERGVMAGPLAELEDEQEGEEVPEQEENWDVAFDFEQIAEIEY
ncbi:MAG TPA: PD-(D/E)XK nuclease family protein [Chloroflexi bacterium]|mgnify:CR=1 FL=1|nr:PD-(D/E)XK nuclease family protein [Chloroflexota bacterium]